MEENKDQPFDPSANAAYNPAYKPDYGYEMNAGPPPPYEQEQNRSAVIPGEAPISQVAYTSGAVVITGNIMHRDAPILPQSYIVHNILILVFCCILFGIIGIVKGSQVNSLYAMGNYAAAEDASQSARRWYIWGVGCGVAVYIILFITYMILLFD